MLEAGAGPGGQRGARSCGARGRVEPRAPRVHSLAECSSFSPPTTVILLILLCFEGLLFLIFTSVMFGTQVHSICTDETVSTGAACHHSLHSWGLGAGGCLQVRPGSPVARPRVCRAHSSLCSGLWSSSSGTQVTQVWGPTASLLRAPPASVMVQSCPRLCVTLQGTGVPFLSSSHGPGDG